MLYSLEGQSVITYSWRWIFKLLLHHIVCITRTRSECPYVACNWGNVIIIVDNLVFVSMGDVH